MHTEETDVLIIGSGVAGAAIAQTLLEENPNLNLTLLEAGGKVPMRDFALHQNYLVTGKLPYEQYHDYPYPSRDSAGENQSLGPTMLPMQGSRLLMYGGSTVHWGGWSFRLKPEDFELQSRLQGQEKQLKGEYDLIDWPISYDDLEPFYVKAEHYIGVSGDSADPTVHRSAAYPYPAFPYTLEDGPSIEGMQTLNIQYSHMPIARHGIKGSSSVHPPCQTTGTCKYCPFGARYAAANYLDDLKSFYAYPNFKIITHAKVESLLMDSAQRVSGVLYVNQNTHLTDTVTLKAKLVVMAAGAVESSKLLLRSKNDFFAKGIGNQHDLVGRNLITHPYLMFEAELAQNPQGLMPEMDFPTMVSRHFDSPDQQLMGKYIIVNPPSSIGEKLAKQMQAGQPLHVIQDAITGKTKIQLHVLLEIFSQTRNRLYNGDKRNHVGLLDTAIEFDQGPDFEDRIQQIQAQIAEIFQAMGASNTKLKTISWRADHAACTTRMADNEQSGVVDKDLKVFGVDNLFICSNSSFSSLGAVNPTLTLASLALRLGEHLNTHVLPQLVTSKGKTAQTKELS